MNKLNNLIDRAKRIKIGGNIDIEKIRSIEKCLGIKFPEDFVELSSKYSYEYLGSFEMYNFNLLDEYSVQGATLQWRDNINLPHNFVVFGENGSSAVIMQLIQKGCMMIWCSLEDVLNLCDGLPMMGEVISFESFTDFFEFLLNEEEKMQAEDALLKNSGNSTTN